MIKSSRNVKCSALVSSLVFSVTALTFVSPVSAMRFGEWSAPVNLESIPGTSAELNTPFNDGCPIQSPDGLNLFIASNRPGGLGGQDIWVAHRARRNEPWGAPENLGAPVNSAFDEIGPNGLPSNDVYVTMRERRDRDDY